MVAKVAVSAAVYGIDKPYSYRCGPEQTVLPGVRVQVPFGKGNRLTEGIVLAVDASPTEERELKEIRLVLDEEPILTEGMLRLAAFMADRYFCTFYEAVKAIVPAGFWFSQRERCVVTEKAADWRQALAGRPAEAQVMALLTELGGEADRTALNQQLSQELVERALPYLYKKGYLMSQKTLTRKVSDKTERIASLAVPAEEALAYARERGQSARVQREVLSMLAVVGSASTKELTYFTGCSLASLRRLQTLGFLELSHREVFRRPQAAPAAPAASLALTPDQLRVYEGLLKQSAEEKPGVALLYGVTGSGKTAVYLKLVRSCLERGQSAVILVPEIALTPQVQNLFTAHFQDQVAVLHSGLQVTERYDEWKRIRRGEARVVLGTRSAVFAPVRDPGLFIVDEEQERTYKSENTPRYHAREIAIYRGARESALVLLGSATPSVESMYLARTGVYRLCRLENRFNGRQMPQVTLIDMKQELREGNGGVFSRPLVEALERTLERKEQAILFLNRRGYSRFAVCVDCGYIPQCPRCSANLTYHAANHRLMCHYCGHSQPVSDRCPQCGGPMKRVGAGTQRAEEEFARLFPGVELLRMDADTISAANTHQQILTKFAKEKIPVLLGTQMVSKGLNFPAVTLVGVLDADASLYVDSFRAGETTFSMLTQVVGRAGRGDAGGCAMIQTLTPEAEVLQLAAAQDYDRFYERELPLRQLRACPPFWDLMEIRFTGVFDERVVGGAIRFKDHLQTMLRQPAYAGQAVRILGPAPVPITRVNNKFRYRLTVCCKNTKQMRQLIAFILREFEKDKRNKGVSVYADSNAFD